MHGSYMNLILCFLCALSVQQMPMAFAARPLKGTRGVGVHARTLQAELPPSEDSADLLPLAEDTEEMPSPDSSEDSGASETNRVAGPSARDCEMCKFQN
jgi:hypothetical protein